MIGGEFPECQRRADDELRHLPGRRPHPPPPPPPGETVQLLDASTQWAYWDPGAPVRPVGRPTGFDDAGLARGAAQLGYGDGDETTVIAFGPSSTRQYVTSYFRSDVHAAALPDRVAPLLADDGASSTSTAWRRSATTCRRHRHELHHAVDQPLRRGEMTSRYFAIPPAPAVGTNTIAVEVHQECRRPATWASTSACPRSTRASRVARPAGTPGYLRPLSRRRSRWPLRRGRRGGRPWAG